MTISGRGTDDFGDVWDFGDSGLAGNRRVSDRIAPARPVERKR